MSILECKALTKRYGGKTALESVDLAIEPGRIVGLLGPNGSGKTTLIKLANGLLTPTDGEILIDGRRPSPETKAIVSYLPDRNALPEWMTVAQTVDYYADFYADFRRDAAQEMIARLGLDVSQRDKTLSKGTCSTSRSAAWIPPPATTFSAPSSATTMRKPPSFSPPISSPMSSRYSTR